MALIALLALGLLGDGFMMYVLFHWMEEGARKEQPITRRTVRHKKHVSIRQAAHHRP
jgi:hypothetical protein